MGLNMKYIKEILIALLIILLTGCSLANNKLTDDYYSYINEDIISKYELNDDEYYWGFFKDSQDKVDDQVKAIISDLIKTNANPNMTILYNQVINTTTRNNSGLSTLTYYLNLIDGSSNIKDFISKAIIVENDLGVSVFTSMTVAADFKDTSKNMIYLYPVKFDFSSPSDYYVDNDYLYPRALVKQYGIKLLKLYGYDKEKARDVSQKIMDYYTSIAKESKMSDYFNDVENMYNIVTKDELKKIYSNLDSTYFDIIPDNVKISILDRGNYEAINASLTNDNLDVLKESVKLKILQTYCQYLTDDYAKIANDLENEQLGIVGQTSTEELARNIVLNLFQYDIDYQYDQKYLSTEAKSYIEEMINDILNYYENSLKNLDWLSKSTREKAITKAKNIKVNIGLDSNYPRYSDNYNLSNSNTLIENILAILKARSDYEYQRLQSNESSFGLRETIVNAYYNPQDNSINFPAAMINLVDFDKDYYENLGTVGMIIAHEITHAFDSNGAKFDEKGNLVNWWTKEDIKNYERLQKKVIDYYDKYEVISGNYLNGKLTVDENIADLGAISCISDIATRKKASKEEFKSMYESFARLFIEKSTDEYTKMLLLADTHSPGKYRVNATLASTDKFYEVYNVSKNNPMFVDKNDRLKIW